MSIGGKSILASQVGDAVPGNAAPIVRDADDELPADNLRGEMDRAIGRFTLESPILRRLESMVDSDSQHVDEGRREIGPTVRFEPPAAVPRFDKDLAFAETSREGASLFGDSRQPSGRRFQSPRGQTDGAFVAGLVGQHPGMLFRAERDSA